MVRHSAIIQSSRNTPSRIAFSRSLFVAAIKRTLDLIVSVLRDARIRALEHAQQLDLVA